MEGTYISWKEHTYRGRNIHIMEGTYISWKEHTYHGRNIHIMEGKYDKRSGKILRFPKRLLARDAPTDGYEEAIVVPDFTTNNFEIKHGLLNLVQNKQFFGHDKEDPHAQIRYFNKITSTMKFPGVPSTSTTNLHNEITRFQQRFDESFYEAWDRFNDLLRACPHHGFSELHQLNTFYNALNTTDQDSLNSAAGGNVLDKMPRKCLKIIESKSRVRKSRSKAVVTKVRTSSSTLAVSSDVVELKDMVRALLLDKKNQAPAPTTIKAVEKSCTQGQTMQNQLTNLTNMLSKFVNANTASSSGSGTLPSNTVTNPKEDLKGITTRSGAAYQGPMIPSSSSSTLSKVVNRETKVTKDTVLPTNNEGTEVIHPPVVQNSEPVVAPFPADFVVVEFEPDPRVPLILERSFLKTGRALIDVYQGEITLCVGKEAITFNLDQTSRYTTNYDHMTANRIDVIDMACEEYSQEVLGFSNVITSGNPSPDFDPIISTSSPTLTPFGDIDFFLFKEANSFLALEDDPTSPEVDDSYYDSEGDILLLEEILNSDPSPPPPNQRNYLPRILKELKIFEAKTVKSSIDEPHKDEEKATLIKVLKSHKRAIAWKLSDIKGVDPEFCTYKILMEEDYEPTVQHQRRLNPKIHDVIKKEVEKLLDAGLIYSISDSPWVSPVHCVPKKGGITVVKNDDNDLIPTRLVTG
nr:reverse transcriptase domain-containing protein [Tanacetum cinerariifolium]